MPLKEPSPWVLNLLATPVGALAAALLMIGWGHIEVAWNFGPSESGIFTPAVIVLAAILIGMAALIAVHELIHAVCYPQFGLTPATLIAFWPSKLLFLAAYYEALPRNRLLLVYLMPFVVLSVLQLLFCKVLGTSSALLMAVSIVNGLFSGGDLVCVALIAGQVPRRAILRNQGWATWWKMA